MSTKIRVAILDDHQSIIDGYLYRLNPVPEIEVVATATSSTELERKLAEHPADILLLDVNAPIAPTNPNPYPTLRFVPQLMQAYPMLEIVVLSMYAERTLIKALVTSGISGYILKDDRRATQNLGDVIRAVADGGIYFSQKIQEYLHHPQAEEPLLTTRQLEVLSMFAAYPDLTTSAVALKLEVAHSTVRNLLSNAYLRLGVHNRTAAILKARQLGLLTSLRPPLELPNHPSGRAKPANGAGRE